MAVSIRPSDKFAFLFAGKDTDQFKADLRKTLYTLINWYGYLPENITVRVSFPVSSLTDTIFSTPGLDVYQITGTDAGELRDSLGASIGALIDDAKVLDADIPAGKINNTLFYFTGEGRQNPGTSLYELEIGTISATPVYVTGIWLKSAIYGWDTTLFVPNSHIHIVMQQSKGYGIWQDAFDLIADLNLRLSFTAACNSGVVNPSNAAGSQFTDYWTQALQFVQRDKGLGVMIYADQEDTGGSEPANNLLVSLNKAYLYANSFTSGTTAPQYKTKLPAGDPADQYLGLPSFWIRDGDEPIPPETSDYWWESKDIFLTHPPDTTRDDEYHPNEQNDIHVIIRNNGTHPVREFYTGTLIFLTGGGGVGESTEFIHTVILKPGDFYEHIYPWSFTDSEVHRCIRSRASLTEITAEQMDQDGTDDIAWVIEDNSHEAQRNLDKQPDAGKSGTGTGGTAPGPGEGKADEANPEAEARPPADANGIPAPQEGTTESKTTQNLRNFREHNIYIRNIFKRRRKFILAFPEDFKKALKFSRVEWCEKDRKTGKYKILKPLGGLQPHLAFDLKPGEVKELILYTSQKPGKRQNFRIKVPFEILVETESLKDDIVRLYKGIVRKSDIPGQMPFSGFTVELYKADGATLHGTVFDAKSKPVPGAYVFVSSGDRNQSAIMKTNKTGSYCVKDINPDNYIIKVKTKDWKSFAKVVHLGEGKILRVDFFHNEKQKKPEKRKIVTK